MFPCYHIAPFASDAVPLDDQVRSVWHFAPLHVPFTAFSPFASDPVPPDDQVRSVWHFAPLPVRLLFPAASDALLG